MALRHWWSALTSRPARATKRTPSRPALSLESLECRVVPANAKLVSFADPSFTGGARASANGQSEAPPTQTISDNGKFLVFASTGANFVAGQTGPANENVYLYDVANDKVTLVSHKAGSATTNGNRNSFNPVISADGSTIAFFSFANNLQTGVSPANGTVQLYLYDRASGGLTLVSHQFGLPSAPTDAVNPFIPSTPSNSYGAINTLGYYAGIPGFITGGGIGLPSLSDDGKYVAWISNASDLGANINDSGLGLYTEAFLYDRAAGTNTLISSVASDPTTGADGFASTISISGDGTTVAFTSPATGITTANTDGVNDQLYVWSRTTNSTTGLSAGQVVLASHQGVSTNDGASIPSSSYLFGFTGDAAPSITKNGAFVAYYHAGDDLVTGQAGTASVLNVFRYDVNHNTNQLVTSTGDGVTAGDNPENRIAPLGVGPSEATGPQISDDGNFIAYANNSSDLGGLDFTNGGATTYDGRDQVYLYDASNGPNGTNTLVSHIAGSATDPSPTGASAPSMTADGKFVAYIDWAYPADGSNDPVQSVKANIRLFDRTASSTTIPPSFSDVYDDTLEGDINAAVLAPTVMSADGSVVAWNATADDIVPNDNNGRIDVFIVTTSNNGPTDVSVSITNVPQEQSTQFATLSTTDSSSSSFTYSFVTGTGDTDNGKFTLTSDGKLSTASTFPLDASQTTFSILVQTTDSNNLSLQKQLTLTLNKVVSDLSISTNSVPQSQSTQFATLSTTDSSSSTFTYSLVTGGTDNSKFTLTSDGKLSTTSNFPLDGSQTTFSIRVQTTDSGNLSLQKTLTLTLVKLPTDVSLTTTRVPGEQSFQFSTLTTTGDPGRTFIYTLGGTDKDKFTIIGDKLFTSSTFPLNGSQTTFSVSVTTADSAFPSLTFTKPFTITLVPKPTTVTLTPNTTISGLPGSTGGTFGTDVTGSTIVYTLVSGGTDNSLFTISNGKLGTTTDGSTFPKDTTTTDYTVRIRAADSDYPNDSAAYFEKVLIIHVSLPPADVSVNGGTTATVAASPGQVVGTLTTTANNFANRTFAYSILSVNGSANNNQFVTSGALLKTDTNISTTAGTYTVIVRATDSADSGLFRDVTLTITTTATPPAPTDIGLTNTTVDAAPGNVIGTLSTTAAGAGRTFSYSVVSVDGAANNNQFAISGNQLLTGSAVGLLGDSYDVVIRTTDDADSSLFDDKTFTITTETTAPTDVALNNGAVEATPGKTVGTLSTTALASGSRTFSYSIVSVDGAADNNQFAVVGDQLMTGTNLATSTHAYTVRVRTTDDADSSLFYEKDLTVNATAVPGPTGVMLTGSVSVLGVPGQLLGTLSTTTSASGRSYVYSIVSVNGSANNGQFAVVGDQLMTGANISGTPAQYSVVIQTTDANRSDLTAQNPFTITTSVVVAHAFVTPPASIIAQEGTPTLLNVSVSVDDPNVLSLRSVVFQNLPSGATLSAGTNNGGGTWTVPVGLLSFLTLTVPDNLTTTLRVYAIADVIGQGTTVQSDPASTSLTVLNTAPTVTVTGGGVFDPTTGPVTLNLKTTDKGTDTVSSVTVNWGDGTVQTISGSPTTLTHQYALLDRTYQVAVTVTDEDGSYDVPSTPTYDLQLSTPTQAVVANLYEDVLGRGADLSGLMSFSQLVDAGASIDTVVRAMVASPEYKANVVNDLYVKYLGRMADDSGLASGVAFLDAGGDPRDLAVRLLASDEFFNNAGGTNDGYLRALFQTALGREIDQATLTADLALLTVPAAVRASVDQATLRLPLAQGVVYSEEARTAQAEEFYQDYLNRQGDADGVAAHAEALAHESAVDVALTYLTADEYKVMATTS